MLAAAVEGDVLAAGDARFKEFYRVVACFPEAALAEMLGVPRVPAVPVAEVEVGLVLTEAVVKMVLLKGVGRVADGQLGQMLELLVG